MRAEEAEEGADARGGREGRAGEQRDRARPAARRASRWSARAASSASRSPASTPSTACPATSTRTRSGGAGAGRGGARPHRPPRSAAATCAASCAARSGRFRSVRVRFGRADYEHIELEGDEIGTCFTNESWEGRLELTHRAARPVHAARSACRLRDRDFAAIGAEAFVPPTVTDTLAVFACEEVRPRPAGGSSWAGASRPRTAEATRGRARDAQPSTASAGSLGLALAAAATAGAPASPSRARSKLPTAEELFSNGPHLATARVRDRRPRPRRRRRASASTCRCERRARRAVAGELILFANRFDGFIFEEPTGEAEDGLDVVRFVQRDARVPGRRGVRDRRPAAPRARPPRPRADGGLRCARSCGTPASRCRASRPPRRRGAPLPTASAGTAASRLRRTAEQDRVAALERPTDGYTLLNASLGYRLFVRPDGRRPAAARHQPHGRRRRATTSRS